MASKVRIPTIVEGQELGKAQKRPRTTCRWLARVRVRLRANLTTAASHYTLIAGRYEVSGEQQQQRVGSFTRSRYRPHQNRRFRHPDPDLDPDPGPPALGPRRPGPDLDPGPDPAVPDSYRWRCCSNSR